MPQGEALGSPGLIALGVGGSVV